MGHFLKYTFPLPFLLTGVGQLLIAALVAVRFRFRFDKVLRPRQGPGVGAGPRLRLESRVLQLGQRVHRYAVVGNVVVHAAGTTTTSSTTTATASTQR